MKQSDFEHRPLYAEFKSAGAEPSLEMMIEKYYSLHMDKDEARKYTNRYIAQMIAETQSGE